MVRTLPALLSALAILGPGAARAGENCHTPAELRAAHLRQLHQEMQLSTLDCAQVSRLHEDYLTRFDAVLSDNAKTLRGYFARNFGSDGQREFDRYLTRLANNASSRAHYRGYCDAQKFLFEIVLGLRPDQLEAFAVKMIPRPDELGACDGGAGKRPGGAPSPG